jgi:hypothetical protein
VALQLNASRTSCSSETSNSHIKTQSQTHYVVFLSISSMMAFDHMHYEVSMNGGSSYHSFVSTVIG